MLIAIHSAKGGCQAASKATRRLSVKQSHIPHYFIFSSIIPKWLESYPCSQGHSSYWLKIQFVTHMCFRMTHTQSHTEC